jgi:hypothetical protein
MIVGKVEREKRGRGRRGREMKGGGGGGGGGKAKEEEKEEGEGDGEGLYLWKDHITIEDAKAIEPSNAYVAIRWVGARRVPIELKLLEVWQTLHDSNAGRKVWYLVSVQAHCSELFAPAEVQAWVRTHVSSRLSTACPWDVVFLLWIHTSSLCLSPDEFIFSSVEDGWMGKGCAEQRGVGEGVEILTQKGEKPR